MGNSSEVSYTSSEVSAVASNKILVDALRAFVLPIVHDYAIGEGAPLYNRISLEPGTDLLAAMRGFILSILPEIYPLQKEEKDTVVDEIFPNNREHPLHQGNTNEAVTARSMSLEVTATKPPVLSRALEETHHFIFNKFPIRVLSFDSKGNNIKLIERGAVWDTISQGMVLAFAEDQTENARIAFRGGKRSRKMFNFRAQYRRYAILSHTWLQEAQGEVTYSSWRNQTYDEMSAGYQKLANFCRTAATEHGLTFGWMDSVCINKDSSSELDESIRSMFNWYQTSAVCLTYLAGTTDLQAMHLDRWFTRGWTLQELVAPKFTAFYDAHWQRLCPGPRPDTHKPDILEQILAATSITQRELNAVFSRNPPPISRRMQWAANRTVTREEDTAYSLMGLFGVSMSTAYGEGADRAFLRLVKEILSTNTRDLLDIVNHGNSNNIFAEHHTTVHTSRLLPTSPQLFNVRADSEQIWNSFTPRIPIALTQLGLHVSALLMPGVIVKPAQRPWPPFTPLGNYFASFDVRFAATRTSLNSTPVSFHLLDKAIYDNSKQDLECMTFAVLNHTVNGDRVEYGDTCFAVAFDFSTPNDGEAIGLRRTFHPLTFKLHRWPAGSSTNSISRHDLERNGMCMRTLYL